MSNQLIPEITSHIETHAQRYFPTLQADNLQVIHQATTKRPSAMLLYYDIVDGRNTEPILAKIHYSINTENPNSDRPRRFFTKAEEKYQLYAKILIEIEELFQQVNDEQFGYIRLLDTLPHIQTLIMTKVNGKDMRLLFLKQNRLQSLFNKADLLPIFFNVGVWLSRFHQLEMSEHVQIKASDADSLLHDIDQMIKYLRSLKGMQAYFDNVQKILQPYPIQIFSEVVPFGRMHGDFALRNILIGENKCITVIDTLGIWQTPIYEDIAYFIIRLWTNQLQVFTQGLAYSDKWVNQCKERFLKGYFGQQPIPRKTITFYNIICLLDQWVSLKESLKKSSKLTPKIRFQLTLRFYKNLLNKYLEQLQRTNSNYGKVSSD